ncbi:hypothetical protein VLK31_21400 [Variovorax sp. H27-G14]|uniref:hypothetical protein n=1 Tax=Variovorax sp. H27-G14 TaxID=3111914 RepID=UPI0038FC5268
MNLDASAAPIFEVDSPDQLLLHAPVVVALSNAFKLFAQTGQELKNFNVRIAERKQENGEEENGEDENGAHTIGIAFSAKLPPGQKGIGNASKLGRSVLYIASRTSGEILREQGSR